MDEMINNQWLVQNNKQFQKIKRQLVEYVYKGLTDLPARTIQGLMESSIFEIARLQRELDAANNELKKLRKTEKDKEVKEEK